MTCKYTGGTGVKLFPHTAGSDSGTFDDMRTADSCLHVDNCNCHGAVCCLKDPDVRACTVHFWVLLLTIAISLLPQSNLPLLQSRLKALEFECEAVNKRWQHAQEGLDRTTSDLERLGRLQETTQALLANEQAARATAERALSQQRALTIKFQR